MQLQRNSGFEYFQLYLNIGHDFELVPLELLNINPIEVMELMFSAR